MAAANHQFPAPEVPAPAAAAMIATTTVTTKTMAIQTSGLGPVAGPPAEETVGASEAEAAMEPM